VSSAAAILLLEVEGVPMLNWLDDYMTMHILFLITCVLIPPGPVFVHANV
jgi:hypothetical protein